MNNDEIQTDHAIDVQFIDWADKTGTTTDRAVFRATRDGEHLFYVAVGVSDTVLAVAHLTEEQAKAVLFEYGPEYVRELAADPAVLAELQAGPDDQRRDITTYNDDGFLAFAAGMTDR